MIYCASILSFLLGGFTVVALELSALGAWIDDLRSWVEMLLQ